MQGLVGDTAYGAGGETVTQAFIRILTALVGRLADHVRAHRLRYRPCAYRRHRSRRCGAPGLARGGRQTAAFYLLARHALTRHWWIGEDSLRDIPEPYRAWHAHRLRDIREAPKRLAFDEFHRTAGAPAVRAQVERDVREARKLRVRLSLASQRLEDFGGALTELANRYWILGAGGKAREIEALSGIFALSETLQDAIRYRLPGPGKDGAPALLIASDARGRFEQLVVNTPGPAELWALTTSPADVALRSRLQARLAPANRAGRPGPGLPHGHRALPASTPSLAVSRRRASVPAPPRKTCSTASRRSSCWQLKPPNPPSIPPVMIRPRRFPPAGPYRPANQPKRRNKRC